MRLLRLHNSMKNPRTKITEQGIYVLKNDTHISRWVEEHKSLVCDPCLFAWLLPRLNGVKVVWDVGAFIGDHTAAYLGIEGVERVVAFEPNPDSYYCLDKNVGGDKRCWCFNVAASDGRGTVSFETGDNAGASRITMRGNKKVDAVKLDDFMLGTPAPDFIKIDVEGWEMFALNGMKSTIRRHRPMIFIEINKGALAANGHSVTDIKKFFADIGYEHSPYPVEAKEDDEQYDLLFWPRVEPRM